MLTICFVDVPTEQNAVEEMLAVEASDTDPCVYHSLLHLHLQDLRLHAPLERRPGRICPWNLCSHSSGQFQFQLKLELLFALRFFDTSHRRSNNNPMKGHVKVQPEFIIFFMRSRY